MGGAERHDAWPGREQRQQVLRLPQIPRRVMQPEHTAAGRQRAEQPGHPVGDDEIGRRAARRERRPRALGGVVAGAQLQVMAAAGEGLGEQGEGGLDPAERPVDEAGRADAGPLGRHDDAHIGQ